jgi:hypothetical protein
MPVLREAYPHLEGKYERYYRGPYAPKDYTREVVARVGELRAKYHLDRPHHSRDATREPRGQMALEI